MATEMTGLVRDALIGQLEQLRDQVRQLAEPLSETNFFKKPLEPGNSVGHLILHLTGNLNHFVGAQLGKTGYTRDREKEFTDAKPPTKAETLKNLDDAVATFRQVVAKLQPDDLAAPHPEARFGSVMTALLHILSHFALHRGQMSYIVRLLS